MELACNGWAVALFGMGVALGGSAGCDFFDDPEPSEQALRVDELADAVLPFSVADGVERPRQLYWMQSKDDPRKVEDAPGLLVGVAAAADYAVVVFPSGERTGFDIAWAEVGETWQRVELNDLDVTDVGTVAAATSLEGRVWIAIRERRAPQTIHVYNWRPGESPTEVAFERDQGPSQTPEYIESCRDVALGVDPSGNVDLVYRQGSADIYQARLGSGASSWTHTLVTTDKAATYPRVDGMDVGCLIRLDYDESGYPNVVATRRVLPEPSQLSSPFPRQQMDPSIWGFFADANGQWLPAGFRGVNDAINHQRYFGSDEGPDLTHFGVTHLLSGPYVTRETLDGREHDVLAYRARSFRFDSDTNSMAEFPAPHREVICRGAYPIVDQPFYGAHLAVDAPEMYASSHPDDWTVSSYPCSYTGDTILRSRGAPVRRRVGAKGVRSPAYATGWQAYTFGVCIDRDGKLEVCAGGVDNTSEDRAQYRNIEAADPPIFSIVGDRPDYEVVPVDGPPIAVQVVQESGEPAQPEFEVIRSDLAQSDFDRSVEFFRTDLGDGIWEVTFDIEPLAAYRVTVDSDPRGERVWHRQGRASITVVGEGSYPDPREVVPIRDCYSNVDSDRFDRDEQGVCRVATPQSLTLPVPMPLFVDPASVAAEPWLQGPDGNRVAGTLIEDQLPSRVRRWTKFEPNSPLEPLTRYELHYPEGITNMFGREMPGENLVLPYLTDQAPLELVESVPVAGATDVAVDALFSVTFNGPLAQGLALESHILLERMGAGGQVAVEQVPLTIREQPGYRFELEHAPLQPAESYRLRLTDQITASAASNVLAGAPLTIDFTTTSNP